MPDEPKMLLDVIHAIHYLNEPKGSTALRIIKFMRCLAKKQRGGMLIDVRQALRYGVRKGVLLHQAGKYKICMQSDDSHTQRVEFYRMQKPKEAPTPVSEGNSDQGEDLPPPQTFPKSRFDDPNQQTGDPKMQAAKKVSKKGTKPGRKHRKKSTKSTKNKKHQNTKQKNDDKA